MTMLQRVKLELKLRAIEDIPDDEVLQYLIGRVVQSILNYCNIHKLPKELEDTAAVMAANAYQEAQGGAFKEGTGEVSSVSEAGRSVNFDVSSKVVVTAASLAEQRVSVMNELNKFKRLYKLQEPDNAVEPDGEEPPDGEDPADPDTEEPIEPDGDG